MARQRKFLLVAGMLLAAAAVYGALSVSGGQQDAGNTSVSEPPEVTTAVPGISAEAPAQPAAAAQAASGGAFPPVSGNATIIETAIIAIDGKRIMLFGLESLHPPQRCTINRETWPCWDETIKYLTAMLAEGPVACTPVEPTDYLGRELALCAINGESLNARYVRSGFALALGDEMPEYEALEAAAREEGIGLWKSRFQRPTDWRRDQGMDFRRP